MSRSPFNREIFQFATVVVVPPLAYRFFVLLIITGYRVTSVNGVRVVNISRLNQQWRWNDFFFPLSFCFTFD